MLTSASQGRAYGSTISIPNRRSLSAVLKSFSWFWDGIIANPRDFAEFPQTVAHNNFLTSWKQFEVDVLSLSGDTRFTDILKVLAIRLEFPEHNSRPLVSVVSSHADSLTLFDYQRLCAILAGYRFAELLLLRAGVGIRVSPSSPTADMYLPPSKNTHKMPHGFERLHHWPTVFINFKTTVNKNAAVPRQTGNQDSPSRFLILIGLLVQNEFQSQYTRIENNLLLAALHVYSLTTGIFPKGTIPNLPGEHGNAPIAFADEVSQSECVEATRTLLEQCDYGAPNGKSTSAGHASLCAPLHLALFVSPIYLLFPFRIVKQSFHRRPIIELAHKLGPHKPPILVKYEDLIWDAIFAIAERPLEMKDIILDLASQILVDELETVSRLPEEFNWFRLSDDLRRLPVPAEGITGSDVPNTNTVLPHALSQSQSPLPSSSSPAVSQVTDSPFSMESNDVSSSLSIYVDTHHNMATSSSAPSSVFLPFEDAHTSAHADAIDYSLPIFHPLPVVTPNVVSSPSAGAQSLSKRSVANASNIEQAQSIPTSTSDHSVEPQDRPVLSSKPLFPISTFAESLAHSINMANAVAGGFINPLILDSSAPADLIGNSDSMDCDNDEIASATSNQNIANSGSNASKSDSDQDSEDASRSDSSSEEPRRQNPGHAPEKTQSAGGNDTEEDNGEDERSESSSEDSDAFERDSNTDGDNVQSKPQNKGFQKPKPQPKSSTAKSSRAKASSDKKPTRSQPTFQETQVSSKQDQSILNKPGNSASNPIDIDIFFSLFEPVVLKEYVEKEDISFLREAAPVKIESGFELHAYYPDGKQTAFKIKAHFPIFLDRIKQFFDHATSDYVDDRPRWITAPETSIVKIITHNALATMDPAAVHQLFSSKNVVVTGCPHDGDLKFDMKGLRTITGSMSTQISINDFSIMSGSSDDEGDSCTPSVLSGIVQDLLDNAEDTDTTKILNALDFPLWDGNHEGKTYATDIAAWDVTRGLHTFDALNPYPTGEVRWGVGGLKNTITFLHIDPDGLNTEDTIGTGGKAWGLLRERSGLKMSSIDFFLDNGFCLNEVTQDSNYDFEIIALRPGDRIYMQPGTPHFVFGMENSICYGGHHYSTALMQQTLQGIIHSFILDKFLTNTAHQGSRQLLRRILIFYLHGLMDKKISPEDRAWTHLPNLEQFDGLMNLLSLCVLVILGNVLDFRTYCASSQHATAPLTTSEKFLMANFDINGIPHNERLAICYARGAALHLFAWVRDCCVIHGPDGVVVNDLPAYFLVRIGRAMIRYKRKAEAKNLQGVTHCSMDFLTSQIENVMTSKSGIHEMWKCHSQLRSDSLELEDSTKYRLKWKSGWETTGMWSSAETDYTHLGFTPFDSKYFGIQAKRLHAESSNVGSLLERTSEVRKAKRRKLA